METKDTGDIWVADLEADGLLNEATGVHCGVFKNITTKEIRKFEPTQPYYLNINFLVTSSAKLGELKAEFFYATADSITIQLKFL